jgi:hypothetical protein
MNVMTATPVAPSPVRQNEEQQRAEEVVDIPQQQEAEPAAEPDGEGSPRTAGETAPAADSTEDRDDHNDRDDDEKEEKDEKEDKEEKDDREKEEKKSAAKPKRKSTPRKAAGGTKTLVVLKDGRVQYADTEAVLVVDLDEASSPDTDVHDVLDRLTELRDAVESPGKVDAVKALTELIQEKALG